MSTNCASLTARFQSACGNVYSRLDLDADGQPCRLHVTLGKAGGCAYAHLEALSELATELLIEATDPTESLERIMIALDGIKCHKSNDAAMVKSCHEVAAVAIAELLENVKPLETNPAP